MYYVPINISTATKKLAGLLVWAIYPQTHLFTLPFHDKSLEPFRLPHQQTEQLVS
jgi:hypothetical protein